MPSAESSGFFGSSSFAPWIAPACCRAGRRPGGSCGCLLRIGDSQCGAQRFRGLRDRLPQRRCITLANSRRSVSSADWSSSSGRTLAACSASAAARTRTVSASSGCSARSPAAASRISAARPVSAAWRVSSSSMARRGLLRIGAGAEVAVGAHDLGQRARAADRAREARRDPAPRPTGGSSGEPASADKRASRISPWRGAGKRERLQPVLEGQRHRGVVEAAGEDRALADAGLDARVVRAAGEQRGRAAPAAAWRRRLRGARRRRPGPRGRGSGRSRRGRGAGAKSAARRARISACQWARSAGSAMRARCARRRASSAARRSGLSRTAPSVSRRPEQVDDRARGGEERLHRRRAAGAHHVVGVLARRHQREAERAAGAEQRQREVDQPLGGGQAGGVAVERDAPARGRASRASRAGLR